MKKCLRCGKPVTDENHVMCPECREWFRNKPIEIPDDDFRKVSETENIERIRENVSQGEEVISAEGAKLVYDHHDDIIDQAPGSDTNVYTKKTDPALNEYQKPKNASGASYVPEHGEEVISPEGATLVYDHHDDLIDQAPGSDTNIDTENTNQPEDKKEAKTEIREEIVPAEHCEEVVSAEGATLIYDHHDDIIDQAPGSDTNIDTENTVQAEGNKTAKTETNEEVSPAEHGEEVVSAEGATLVYDHHDEIIDQAPGSDTNISTDLPVEENGSDYLRGFESPEADDDLRSFDHDSTIEDTLKDSERIKKMRTAIEEAERAHAVEKAAAASVAAANAATAVGKFSSITPSAGMAGKSIMDPKGKNIPNLAEGDREIREMMERSDVSLLDDNAEPAEEDLNMGGAVPVSEIPEVKEMAERSDSDIPLGNAGNDDTMTVPSAESSADRIAPGKAPLSSDEIADSEFDKRNMMGSRVSGLRDTQDEDPEKKKIRLAVIAFLLVLIAAAVLLLNMGTLFGKKGSDGNKATEPPSVASTTKPVATTAPSTTAPSTTAAATTAPSTTAPAETLPAETQPAETQPAETQPAETQPAETQPVAPDTQGMMFPDSDSRYIATSELNGLSDWECSLARNEIFARHGWIFKDTNLYAYFSQFDWYNPTVSPANFDSSVLNDYEKTNVKTIDQYEKAHGY